MGQNNAISLDKLNIFTCNTTPDHMVCCCEQCWPQSTFIKARVEQYSKAPPSGRHINCYYICILLCITRVDPNTNQRNGQNNLTWKINSPHPRWCMAHWGIVFPWWRPTFKHPIPSPPSRSGLNTVLSWDLTNHWLPGFWKVAWLTLLLSGHDHWSERIHWCMVMWNILMVYRWRKTNDASRTGPLPSALLPLGAMTSQYEESTGNTIPACLF